MNCTRPIGSADGSSAWYRVHDGWSANPRAVVTEAGQPFALPVGP